MRLAQEGCTAQTLLPSPALPGRQLCPISLLSVTPGLYPPGHGDFCVSGWEGLQGSPIPSPPSSPAVDCCLSFPDGWRNVNHRCLRVTAGALGLEGRMGQNDAHIQGKKLANLA